MLIFGILFGIFIISAIVLKIIYNKLESDILYELGFYSWGIIPYIDASIIVKSRQTLEKYDYIKFFKEDKSNLTNAENALNRKSEEAQKLRDFLKNNDYQNRIFYSKIEEKIHTEISNSYSYNICIDYISSAGNHLGRRVISVSRNAINKLKNDPSLLMGKGEYNKYLKEQQKEALDKKHQEYYGKVNNIIEYANENKEILVIKNSGEQLDDLIAKLFDRTVNSIKKIKTLDSEEWDLIGDFIANTEQEIKRIVEENQKILNYYQSSDFSKIKETCETLMSSQKEFNEYINEKVQSIATLFGTRVARNETVIDDQYNFIRPYKKTITPFSAEVSAAVFASAENRPIEYVVKYFYPIKENYPKQIQKLQLLIEELETLKEAKQIIESHKEEYRQYIEDVPDFVLENDEKGFYHRLGFASIDESDLVVEYKFIYTSNGGMAQRYFTVPMTEETIIELIRTLEGKLTASAFAKEQRILMTKKLREFIKKRDNYTCCICGNSTHTEPNLLLEIDHIVPVSKGGVTEEKNLQTLCWKCNRTKSSKILADNIL